MDTPVGSYGQKTKLSPLQKRTLIKYGLVCAAVVLVAAIILVVIFMRKKNPKIDTDSTKPLILSDRGPVLTGTKWMSEPLSGPFPYQLSPSVNYFIEIMMTPFNYNGTLLCLEHLGVQTGISIAIDGSGKAVHYRGEKKLPSNDIVTLNVPHIFAISYDGDKMYLLIDKVQAADPIPGIPVMDTTLFPLIVGAKMATLTQNVNGFMNGEYFYLKIWNGTRSGEGTLLAYYDFRMNPRGEVGDSFTNIGDNGTSNTITLRNTTSIN